MKQFIINKQPVIKRKEEADIISCQQSVLRTLAYFDIFHYPLNAEEIRIFADTEMPDPLFTTCLQQLQEEDIVFAHHEFYSLQNNPLLVHRRRRGNERAAQLLLKAERIGRFLYQFPFVRAVGISGSLSKNFADEKADIDFFIITSANRLWIARTFMHLFKKLTYLAGRQHFYCMNYYIDEKAMLLEEKNIFTAIELKTLLPVSGEKIMQQFFGANKWTDQWLPLCDFRLQQRKDPSRSWFKQCTEWLLSNRVANQLENYLFKITTRRWEKKAAQGKRNRKGQALGLITGKHFAKSNSGSFQEKILLQYEQRLSLIKEREHSSSFIVSSAT
ncbi:MAG TPA: hypothetical protein VF487_04250 [Chitinophagaceae bacterium]